MGDEKGKKQKPDLNLTRNKPYADWKEERLQLREKWGNQGRQVRPPAASGKMKE